MTFKGIPTVISYKSVGEKSFSKDLNPMPKCSKNIKERIAIAGEIEVKYRREGKLFDKILKGE